MIYKLSVLLLLWHVICTANLSTKVNMAQGNTGPDVDAVLSPDELSGPLETNCSSYASAVDDRHLFTNLSLQRNLLWNGCNKMSNTAEGAYQERRQALESGNLFSKGFIESPDPLQMKLNAMLVMEEYDDIDSSLLHLILSIVNNDLKDCVLVLGYDDVFEELFTSKGLLLKLTNLLQIIKITNESDLRTILWEASHCRGYIFLLNNLTPFYTFANQDNYIWDFQGRYVLVGPTKEALENLTTTRKLSKTENLIGIVKYARKGVWGIYTNQLVFGSGLSRLTTWMLNRFSNQDPILYPDKLSNFQGKKLVVTAFDWRPSVMFRRNETGNVIKRYGRDVMVVEGLAQALNASIVYNDAPQEKLWGFRFDNGTWNGLMGIIQRDEADVGIGNMFITNVTFRMLNADFSVPFDFEVSCFMTRTPKPLPKWERILYPFHPTMWFAIIAGLIVSGPLLYAFARAGQQSGGEKKDFQSASFSFLYAFGIQFMEGQALTPTRRGIQIFICFLWIYATIITTGYSSNLTALLTVSRRPPTIDTIKDLHQSDLRVGGMGDLFRIAMASSHNPLLQELSGRYTLYNGRANAMYDSLRREDIAIIAGRYVLQYMLKMQFTDRSKSSARIIKETFSPFGIGVITPRGSPLKRKFDIIISKMVEGGLVSYWFLESLRIAKEEADEEKNKQNERLKEAEEGSSPEAQVVVEMANEGVVQALSFDHLQGFFFILVVGFLFSAMAFIGERLVEARYS